MANVEIEFKYRADSTTIREFTDFCEKKKPSSFYEIHGIDYFYRSAEEEHSFYRHRINAQDNQLTFKRKHSQYNSVIRTEHNLDLRLEMSKEYVSKYLFDLGYKYNFSLTKQCFIYVYEWYTLVYYICYDDNMKELGRFIEIEAKETYPWANNEEALSQIGVMEKTCKSLGLSPSSRLNQSLFEMFRKG